MTLINTTFKVSILKLMIQVPMGKHHAWQLTLSAIMFFNSIMELVGTRNVSKQYPSIINLMLQFIKVDRP